MAQVEKLKGVALYNINSTGTNEGTDTYGGNQAMAPSILILMSVHILFHEGTYTGALRNLTRDRGKNLIKT